jgi:hypothetical protein
MLDIYRLRAAKYQKFIRNQERCGSDETPCIVCGKGCKNPQWMVHLSDGGMYIVTEQEAQEMNDNLEMGWWPVGTDCYRNNPEIRPYAVKQPTIKASDWKRLYFDLYRQANGEQASDDEVMQDAYRRFEILSHYEK